MSTPRSDAAHELLIALERRRPLRSWRHRSERHIESPDDQTLQL